MGQRLSAASRTAGFTLVELLVGLVIVSVLVAASLINLGKPQQTANLSSTLDTLIADIKNQQNAAMAGGSGGSASAQTYGLYVQPHFYVVFPGSTYSAGNTSNFTITLSGNLTLSTTLPSTQVIFVKGTGEVQGYTAGSNTITLTDGTTPHVITFDRFGALNVT